MNTYKSWFHPSDDPAPTVVRLMDAFLFFVVVPLLALGVCALVYGFAVVALGIA